MSSMSPDEPVRLVWALHEGRLRHVSDFAHLAPRERPPVSCPVCREPVTLKLGEVNAHHAAHREASTCPAQTWETALHLNTKHHLAAALRAAAPLGTLVVRHRCSRRAGVLGETVAVPGLVPCAAVHDVPFVDGWDEVQVEVGLATTRPDLLLRRGGQPVALLEVRHTHAITAHKLERLATLGVPWAEVVASRGLYAELTAWAADTPLTVLRTDGCAQWWCDAHRPTRSRRRRGGEHAGPEAAWAARVVDRYLPDGQWVRDVVYLTGTRAGRRVHGATMRRRDDDAMRVSLPNGTTAGVLRAAHAAFVAWAATCRAAGERVDSPMSWAPAASLGDDANGWVAGTSLYPPRLRFARETGRWVRRAGVGDAPWAMTQALDLADGGRHVRRPGAGEP